MTLNTTNYINKGYLHAQHLLPEKDCEQLHRHFINEVKPCTQPKLRQRCVTYNQHKLSHNGFMENALLDVHRLDTINHVDFVNSVCHLLNNDHLTKVLDQLIGKNSILVQTMYFEGGRGTIPHFDKFFLGLETGAMTGVWIALEDIDQSSGRFFIYPESNDIHFTGKKHKDELIDLFEQYKQLNAIAIGGHQKNSEKHHVRAVINSKRVLKKIIELAEWKKEYPVMKKGDVLFFSSSTLHGSDAPDKFHHSRNSLTAHFINTQESRIRYGHVIEPINIVDYNGVNMHYSQRYQFQQTHHKETV